MAEGTAISFSPSFLIRGAGGESTPPLRLDRVNSRELFAVARGVLFRHMETCPDGADPLGVVLVNPDRDPGALSRGRVVFSVPVLLPDEQFVPLDLLLARSQRFSGPRRSRLQVSRPAR
ncbi:MAG: hypothetical protein NTY67_10815 [Cyanobacteria bacterium]|nr:hypothetical protein [Cyanobacteriota bacterium]